MCSNYRTVTNTDRLLKFFGVTVPPNNDERSGEIFPLGLAPFIRLHEDGSGNRIVDEGKFGLLPHFAKEIAYGRRTYNSRSETVDKLPSFRDAWRHGRRCIVPAEFVYEPCYESGKAVRWRVQKANAAPMGIAGIYNQWHAPDGTPHWSFAMLTVNADGHPVYQRMHKPGEEKRMVVILDEDDYDKWLQCTPNEAKQFFRQWAGNLEASPAPLPPRTKK